VPLTAALHHHFKEARLRTCLLFAFVGLCFVGLLGGLGPATLVAVPLAGMMVLGNDTQPHYADLFVFVAYIVKVIIPPTIYLLIYQRRAKKEEVSPVFDMVQILIWPWYLLDLFYQFLRLVLNASDGAMLVGVVLMLWLAFWTFLPQPSDRGAVTTLRLTASGATGLALIGIAAWSLMQMTTAAAQARALSAGKAHCFLLQGAEPAQYRTSTSYFDLRPVVMFNRASGFKNYQPAGFHGALLTSKGSDYNWSYEARRFLPLPRKIGRSCP
jgi:hypothetical protein